MASSYSDLLRFELIGAGEQAGLWGDTTNNNLGSLVEQAIAGVTTVTLSGGAGTVTLSALNGAPDQSRSAVLKFIGVPSGQKDIVIPTKTKLYVVRNECGQTITVKTAAQVTGVTILDGEATLVFCDGTNAVAGIATAGVGPTTVANGGTGATSFVGGFIKSPGGTGILTSSATVSLSTEVTGTLPIANGGTGATSASAARTSLGLGTVSTINTNGSTTQFLRGDGTFATPSTTSGVTSVSGSGNISVSPTTGSPVVSITSTPTFSTVYFGNTSNYISQSGSNLNFIAGGVQTVSITNQGLGANAVLTSTGFYGSATNTTSLGFGSTPYVSVNTSNFFFPNTDNAIALGAGANRWTIVYAVNGTINTSDLNQKTQIASLDDAEKRVAQRVKGLIKKFKFKDAVEKKGDQARIHVGVIAQEVGEAFRAEGLDPDRYGIYCYDEWPAQEEIIKNGVTIQQARKAGSAYGVRYEQLLAFVIAAL